MQQGISIYLGLDNTFEQNITLIQTASSLGIQRIFTSLHIPETDTGKLQKELTEILQTAKAANMEIISDISPNTLKLLGMKKLSFSLLKSWNIHTIRVDFGYSAKEIAKFTNNEKDIRVQLNASTITSKLLADLVKAGANLNEIDALHNFYPRSGTGLSEAMLTEKTQLLRSWGIRTGAFVASNHKRRSPLNEGLPTLECHRGANVSLAARHLAALGVDSVFIGDSLPSDAELAELSAIKQDVIELRARLYTRNPAARALLANAFTVRVDDAQNAVRAQESRLLLADTIPPENTAARGFGAITLDNEGYLRYMGELQIIKTPQPPDPRVNVVARLLPEEEILIPHLTPGRKFSFNFI